MSNEIAIGIDLGTTNSCVAYVEDGKPVIIPDHGGNTITPSIVCVDDSGEMIVGHQAKRRFLTHPQDTIYGAKRLMGRRFDSAEMEEIRKHFHYEIVEDEHGEPAIQVGERILTLEEVSAVILAQLKDAAQEHLGRRIDKTVISVPAYFTQRQRQAVRKAGEQAGFEVLRIINEPTAAALAYGFGKRNAQRLLVFDLGGGTFDVTILQLYEEVYEVIGTGGDSFLGGIDFDNAIVDLLLERFEAKHGLDLRPNRVAMQRIRDAAERAKIDLSSVPSAEVHLPFITMHEGESLDLHETITREEYHERVKPLVLKALKITERTIREAGLTRDKLDEIIFVGGMTRAPIVYDMVTRYFGKRPRKDVHPDEVVAQGAAILADALMRGAAGVTLVDVLPVSIGIAVGRGEFRKIINKNTSIPTERIQLFRTTRDNQTGVRIKVYQGESRHVANNEFLGELVLTGFPPRPKGQVQIEIRFQVDRDSILHVKAREQSTGREIKARFITEAVVQRERYRADKILEGTQTAATDATRSPGSERDTETEAQGAPEREGSWWSRLWRRLFGRT